MHRLPSNEKAFEGGGGIGRVTISVLQKCFNTIHFQEQQEHLLKKAKANVLFIRKFIGGNLKDIEFEDKYDCIWL